MHTCLCAPGSFWTAFQLLVNKLLRLKHTQSERPHVGVLRAVQKIISKTSAPVYFCKCYTNGQIPVTLNKQGQSKALECFQQRCSHAYPLAAAASRGCARATALHRCGPQGSPLSGPSSLRQSSWGQPAGFQTHAPSEWHSWAERNNTESIPLTYLQDKEQRQMVQPQLCYHLLHTRDVQTSRDVLPLGHQHSSRVNHGWADQFAQEPGASVNVDTKLILPHIKQNCCIVSKTPLKAQLIFLENVNKVLARTQWKQKHQLWSNLK